MNEWIHAHEVALWWLAAVSVLTFLATLIAVPWLIIRLPADYFAPKKRHRNPWDGQHFVLRWTLLACKNLLGCVFIAAGILMLVLPGQGILTMVIGLSLLDFPGKYALERWLVSRGPVLQSINWMRRRAGRPPLVLKG